MSSALMLLSALALCAHGATGLRAGAGVAVGRPLRVRRAYVRAADDADLSDAERREIMLAEGELPMPTPMKMPMPVARSAFAQPDGARKPGAPPLSRPEEVNAQLLTKATNTLKELRWSEEPILLTAVKTATWGAIGLAVLFEIYLQLNFEYPNSSGL